jgi:phosphoglycerate kinase
MKYKTLDNFNFKGKKVLLRADLNSPVIKGRVVMNDRIVESAKTINELKRKGARVVVLAHQSRPGKKDFRGLKEHAKLLKVKFVEDIIGKKALGEIERMKDGDAILLDNVRKLKEEFKPSLSNKLVRAFRDFDVYINDAFSVSHRRQTTIVSFPRVMKSGVGRLMEKELKSLEKIRKMKDCLFILGGAKPEENIALIKGRKNILVCGLFGQLCLTAGGYDLGAQNKVLRKEMKYTGALKRMAGSCTRPLDLAVNANGRRVELDIEDFPSKYYVYDIGKKTQAEFISRVRKAKCIFMKGPAGYCEDKKFCEGTLTLLKAIATSRGFSVLAGGHLNSALERSGISKKRFGYVSLSGGALAAFLAGKKLVGLEALRG